MSSGLTCLCVVIFVVTSCYCHSNKLLLISLDGFRWDYMDMVDTPNLHRMAREGVRAPDGLINTFVTKTFPCHYTIVTGLYEESHGIIANNMYDPVFNETFSTRTTDSKWWNGGEPIWVTAVKQGLKTAVYLWPGSQVEIRGYRPDIWFPYSTSVPFKTRVDSVVGFLNNLEIDIALLYIQEPDKTGHKYGPNSPEIKEKVTSLDGVIGYLYAKLEKAGILDKTNIILTSDHGMTQVDMQNKTIQLLDYLDGSLFDMIDEWSVGNLRPTPGKSQEVYAALKDKHPNMTVYLKADLPERFHYKNNRRVMDIVIVPDEGWTVVKNKSGMYYEGGNHGYDNKYTSMRPFFLARGPNFKKNYKVKTFETVNIYPLICKLLNIKPSPNNGSYTTVQDMVTGIPSKAATLGSSCYVLMYLVILSPIW